MAHLVRRGAVEFVKIDAGFTKAKTAASYRSNGRWENTETHARISDPLRLPCDCVEAVGLFPATPVGVRSVARPIITVAFILAGVGGFIGHR